MKRRGFILAAFAILVGALLYYFYGGGQAPPGQPPLVSLTTENFSSLKDAFNRSPDYVRIIVLLSPT